RSTRACARAPCCPRSTPSACSPPTRTVVTPTPDRIPAAAGAPARGRAARPGAPAAPLTRGTPSRSLAPAARALVTPGAPWRVPRVPARSRAGTARRLRSPGGLLAQRHLARPDARLDRVRRLHGAHGGDQARRLRRREERRHDRARPGGRDG